MLNRFKSALYNVVGNFDPTEGGTISHLGTVSLTSGVQNIPSVIRQNNNQGKEKTVKFPYTRPHFLQLNSEDEILVTADHALRPIICPRDISRLPWKSGYAETINAGKSKRNEDQSAIHVGLLTRSIKRSKKNVLSLNINSMSKEVKKEISSINGVVQNKDLVINDSHISQSANEENINETKNVSSRSSADLQNGEDTSHSKIHSCSLQSENEDSSQLLISLPYYYFGVFDGHAGWGAAVSAANQLHHIIHEKLCDVIELIIPDSDNSKLCDPFWSSEKTVSPESAIIGALEQAFWTMDQQIGEDRQKHHLSGGCTACIVLFILGKVFVSNAGDSRGVIGIGENSVPMSFDFTPETETQRIRKLGARHPELLGGEFTHLEFLRRPLRSDVGKKAPFRDHYMKGWGLKTITEADLKYPLVCGEGKRSRVLATIGVTRGFGDHDLKAQFSSLPIKPFLSPEPEVRVLDLNDFDLTDQDVLILGTDGLWDIISNEKAVSIVWNSLQQFSLEDSHRYTSAAHDLVLWSRGRLREHHQWRTADDKHATIDDISAFVIPLHTYKMEYEQWQRDLNSPKMTIDPSEEVIVPSEVKISSRSYPTEPPSLSEIEKASLNGKVDTSSSASDPSENLSTECAESSDTFSGKVDSDSVNPTANTPVIESANSSGQFAAVSGNQILIKNDENSAINCSTNGNSSSTPKSCISSSLSSTTASNLTTNNSCGNKSSTNSETDKKTDSTITLNDKDINNGDCDKEI